MRVAKETVDSLIIRHMKYEKDGDTLKVDVNIDAIKDEIVEYIRTVSRLQNEYKEIQMKSKKIKPICNKCGKEQKPDKNSNKNWDVYPSNEKCVCGGIFKIIF